MFMTKALLKTGKHTVTAITRADSTSELPDGVRIKKINYDDQSSIVDALRGQDALIITMGVRAPKDQEPKLIEAAAEANVPWIFPNAWSPDTADPALSHEMLIGDAKQEHQRLIKKLGKSSWIAVSTGFWYEWSLALKNAYGFDFDKRAVTFFDEGETLLCTSTWPQVGRAMASLLSLKIHPDGASDHGPCLDKFRDSYIYISSFTVNQKDMLESVLRVTKTSQADWTITKEPSHARYAAGIQQMQQGDMMGFTKALYTRVFYPEGKGNVEKIRGLQNDVLDLPKEDIDEFTQIAIERSKDNPYNR